MDNETSKNLTDADHVENMIGSDGWNIIKSKLDTRILDLQNINNLDLTDINTLSTQLASRKMAVDMIYAWLKDDVYGFVEQQRVNMEQDNNIKEDIISRL
jgi:hypothetical protein